MDLVRRRHALVIGGSLAALLAVAGGYWLRRASRVHSMEVLEFSEGRARDPAVEGPLPEQVGWDLAGVGRQRAWLLPGDGADFVVVVHGSPGTGLGLLPLGRALVASGFGVLLLDLPGYGGSAGHRVWDSSYPAAIRAAIDYLVAQQSAERVLGVGYSMGTCVLAQAAAEDPRCARLVLLAPFTRLADQLHHQYRGRLPAMGRVAIRAAESCGVCVADLDTLETASALEQRPVLLVAGGQDSVVPASMAADLHRALGRSELWVMPEAGHARLVDAGDAGLVARITAFLEN